MKKLFFRYTLRIKFFPEDLKDFHHRDKASFFFLYDQVIYCLTFINLKLTYFLNIMEFEIFVFSDQKQLS